MVGKSNNELSNILYGILYGILYDILYGNILWFIMKYTYSSTCGLV